LANGGERYHREARASGIVEAGDGHALRAALLGGPQSLNRPERGMVVDGQQGVEAPTPLTKLSDGAVPAGNRKVTAHDIARVQAQAVTPERLRNAA
jgi:hypothetical protein